MSTKGPRSSSDIKPGQIWRNKHTGETQQVLFAFQGQTGTYVTLSDGDEYTPNVLLEYWDLAEGGSPIITALSFAAEPPTKGAREMSTEELETALGNWQGWRKTYGGHSTDEGLAFKQTANQQLGRIRRELKRRKEGK